MSLNPSVLDFLSAYSSDTSSEASSDVLQARDYVAAATIDYDEHVKSFLSIVGASSYSDQIFLLLADLHGWGGAHNLGGAFLGQGDMISNLGSCTRLTRFNWSDPEAPFWRDAYLRVMSELLRDQAEFNDSPFPVAPISEFTLTPQVSQAKVALSLCDDVGDVQASIDLDASLQDRFVRSSYVIPSIQSMVNRGLLAACEVLDPAPSRYFPQMRDREAVPTWELLGRWQKAYSASRDL